MGRDWYLESSLMCLMSFRLPKLYLHHKIHYSIIVHDHPKFITIK